MNTLQPPEHGIDGCYPGHEVAFLLVLPGFREGGNGTDDKKKRQTGDGDGCRLLTMTVCPGIGLGYTLPTFESGEKSPQQDSYLPDNKGFLSLGSSDRPKAVKLGWS
jgi:hypothetical protein